MTSIIKVDQIQNAAGGTPTAADLGLNVSGSVLQVVQDYKTDATIYNGVDTYHNVMSVTITPKSSNSKMLISSDVSYAFDGGQTQYEWYFYLDRSIGGGASSPVGTGDAAGSRQTGWFQPYGHSSNNNMMLGTLSGTYLDSPATTQAITYNLMFRSHTHSFYINRSVTDTNGAGYSKRLTSNLTVQEIAG